jgi:hypothetical protein
LQKRTHFSALELFIPFEEEFEPVSNYTLTVLSLEHLHVAPQETTNSNYVKAGTR